MLHPSPQSPSSTSSSTTGKSSHRLSRPVLFALAVTSLTGIMGQRFYNQPELGVGRIAPATIMAPETVRVEDKKSTEEQRKAARTGAIPVLQVDPTLNQQMYQDLQRWLDQGDELREAQGVFPLVASNYVSLNSQIYLREASEAEWQEILAMVNQAPSSPGSPNSTPASTTPGSLQPRSSLSPSAQSSASFPAISSLPSPSAQSSSTQAQPSPDPTVPGGATAGASSPSEHSSVSPNPNPDLNSDFSGDVNGDSKRERAIEELLAYRNRRSIEEFTQFLERLVQARQAYKTALSLLASQINDFQTTNPAQGDQITSLYQPSFLNLTDSTWQETQVGIYTALERLLTQGLAPGTSPEIIERAVRIQVSLAVPAPGEPLAVELLLRIVRPNLRPDPERTKQQAEQAAESVEPIYVEVREGEPIVRAGEEITQAQFVLLDHFGKSKRSPNWSGLVGFGIMVLGGVTLFVVVAQRLNPKMRRRDRVLILLLTLSTPLLVLLRVPTTSLPAVGILMGSFYGSPLGALTVGLLAVGLPLGLDLDPNLLFPGAAGGLVAALVAGQLRSREELALLGAGVGLTQGLVHLLLSLILTAAAGQVWYILLPDAALTGLEGVLWCIVAFGLSPYLEHLFDLLTPIRLAELSNPNRPMLQRLASEAPGTFQHTLFVATLAEAAARRLRCNVELVRAGTLYHDIGKMHDPQGFIENQMGGTNKHNEINDPWISATIIKKHVTEGLVMARKCRLPKALQAFIPEHQGTMLIAYFYHEAQELEKQDSEQYSVKEADFRYPGPIPQSRETGIVMLADSCEAALRSLKEATPDQALAMVTKIIRARWQDQQLVDSGLKREEMDTIAQVFVEIWQQFHHQRIPYPSTTPSPAPTTPLASGLKA